MCSALFPSRKKDIKAIKQKAERGFVEALTKFHYGRLEKQKQKLHKEMSVANRKGRKDSKNVNVSTTFSFEAKAWISLRSSVVDTFTLGKHYSSHEQN